MLRYALYTTPHHTTHQNPWSSCLHKFLMYCTQIAIHCTVLVPLHPRRNDSGACYYYTPESLVLPIHKP